MTSTTSSSRNTTTEGLSLSFPLIRATYQLISAESTSLLSRIGQTKTVSSSSGSLYLSESLSKDASERGLRRRTTKSTDTSRDVSKSNLVFVTPLHHLRHRLCKRSISHASMTYWKILKASEKAHKFALTNLVLVLKHLKHLHLRRLLLHRHQLPDLLRHRDILCTNLLPHSINHCPIITPLDLNKRISTFSLSTLRTTFFVSVLTAQVGR